jgi:hypothetical protein
MLKRAVTGDQVVKMNRTDFDKAGGGKKVGFNFVVEFKNGKVQNQLTSLIAKDLVAVLQADEGVNAIFQGKSFQLELNPKCELFISYTPVPEVAKNETPGEQLPVDVNG